MGDRAYWVGVALGLALLLTFALASGALAEKALLVQLTDFSGYWAGGRALLLGADPYDPERWRATTELMGTQVPDTRVYGYTPWVALLMAPLALLPLDVAATVWLVAGFAIAALGIASLLRVAPCPPAARCAIGFLLGGSQPAQSTLFVGQWSFLLTGMLALATTAVLADRPPRAVGPLLFSLAKPQLFLVSVPALLWRRWRVATVFVCGVAAVVLIATAAMPDWIAGWVRYVPAQRFSDPPRTPVLGALMFEILGPLGVILAAMTVVAFGVLIAVRSGSRGPAALSLWLALSAVSTPYSWSYDWLLLLVPLVLGLSALGNAYPDRARLLAVTGVVMLMVPGTIGYVIAITRGSNETYSALVPLVLFLALLGLTWPVSARPRTA